MRKKQGFKFDRISLGGGYVIILNTGKEIYGVKTYNV